MDDALRKALDEFYAAQHSQEKAPEPCSLVSFKPMASDALAVHPKQIEGMKEVDKKKGVSVEYTADGRPIFTSSRQFRAYARAYGKRHKGY